MVNYAFVRFDEKTMARVTGKDLPISTKTSREVVKFIKGMNTKKAISYLEQVVELKKPIPYTRFNGNVPHKRGKGFGPGRFPKKTSVHIIALIKSLEKNADAKGLDLDKLEIIHGSVSLGATSGGMRWHYGRRRRKKKLTHVQLVAQEVEKEEKKPAKKKETKKEVSKKETKPIEKSIEVPKDIPKETKEEKLKEEAKEEKLKEEAKEEKLKEETKEEKLKEETKEEKLKEEAKKEEKKLLEKVSSKAGEVEKEKEEARVEDKK